MVLIEKENFNEVIETIIKAYVKSRYCHKRFTEENLKQNLRSLSELESMEIQLQSNKVNLAKYLKPVYIKYGLGWNHHFDEEFYKDYPNEIPDKLKILVDLPTISSKFTETQKEKFLLKF